MKNLKGTLTISNPQPTDTVEIKIDDEDSGVRIIEFQLSYENFAKALMRRANCQGTILFFNDSDKVGMLREHKSLIVPRLDAHGDREAQARALWAEWEVDGWEGSVKAGHNHHNWVGKDKVKVSFTRWVPKDAQPTDDNDAGDAD